jgi:hypothetical protein
LVRFSEEEALDGREEEDRKLDMEAVKVNERRRK